MTSVEACDADPETTYKSEDVFITEWNGRSCQILKKGREDFQRIEEVLKQVTPIHLGLSKGRVSWIQRCLEEIGVGMIDPDLLDPNISLLDAESSFCFSTQGKREPHLQIGGINGMGVSKEEAFKEADYTAQFALNYSIDWTYNCSHGKLLDLLEIFLLNYQGVSLHTATILQNNWREFHLKNQENPEAKYLQFCHSQGALHVRNALLGVDQEIASRILVVAIAPAVIVPNKLCFKSYNYASSKDPIPYGELFMMGCLDPDEKQASYLEELLKTYQELVLLESYPEMEGIDHAYESKTFQGLIESHILNYLSQEGRYA